MILMRGNPNLSKVWGCNRLILSTKFFIIFCFTHCENMHMFDRLKYILQKIISSLVGLCFFTNSSRSMLSRKSFSEASNTRESYLASDVVKSNLFFNNMMSMSINLLNVLSSLATEKGVDTKIECFEKLRGIYLVFVMKVSTTPFCCRF